MSGIAARRVTTGDAATAGTPVSAAAVVAASGDAEAGPWAAGAEIVVGAGALSSSAPLSVHAPPSAADSTGLGGSRSPPFEVSRGVAAAPPTTCALPAPGDGPQARERLEARTDVDIRTHRVPRWSFMWLPPEMLVVAQRESRHECARVIP